LARPTASPIRIGQTSSPIRISGIKTVADIKGHSFAFSDPASTSGHLFPASGLRKNGIDPDKDIKAIFAGSHTSSFEALYNHKVDAGELNSEQLESAKQRGHYKDGDLVFLWKSDPILTDPFCIRRDLPDAFKKRVTEALRNLDLSSLDEADRKIMVGAGFPASCRRATAPMTASATW
jgi:phosphonate transport system substrate-binding protein